MLGLWGEIHRVGRELFTSGVPEMQGNEWGGARHVARMENRFSNGRIEFLPGRL
jgi:hypothetical protein